MGYTIEPPTAIPKTSGFTIEPPGQEPVQAKPVQAQGGFTIEAPPTTLFKKFRDKARVSKIVPTKALDLAERVYERNISYPGYLARRLYQTGVEGVSATAQLPFEAVKSKIERPKSNIFEKSLAFNTGTLALQKAIDDLMSSPDVQKYSQEQLMPKLNQMISTLDLGKYKITGVPGIQAAQQARGERLEKAYPTWGRAIHNVHETAIDFGGLMLQLALLKKVPIGGGRNIGSLLQASPKYARVANIVKQGGMKKGIWNIASKLFYKEIGKHAAYMGAHGVVTTKGNMKDRLAAGFWRAVYNLTPAVTAWTTKGLDVSKLPSFVSKLTPKFVDFFYNSVITSPQYVKMHKETGGFNPQFWSAALPQVFMDAAMSMYTKNLPLKERERVLYKYWNTGRLAGFEKPWSEFKKANDHYIKAVNSVAKQVLGTQKTKWSRNKSKVTPMEESMVSVYSKIKDGKEQLSIKGLRTKVSPTEFREANKALKELNIKGVGKIDDLPPEIQAHILDSIKQDTINVQGRTDVGVEKLPPDIDTMKNKINDILNSYQNHIFALRKSKETGTVGKEKHSGKLIYWFRNSSKASDGTDLTAEKLAQQLSKLGINPSDPSLTVVSGSWDIGMGRARGDIMEHYKASPGEIKMAPLARGEVVSSEGDRIVTQVDDTINAAEEKLVKQREVQEKLEKLKADIDKSEDVLRVNAKIKDNEHVSKIDYPIRITKNQSVTDFFNKKKKLAPGDHYTPHFITNKGGEIKKVFLTNGEDLILKKSQYTNLINQNYQVGKGSTIKFTAEELAVEVVRDNEKWGSYSLTGGENYRNIIFNDPNLNVFSHAFSDSDRQENAGNFGWIRVKDFRTKDGKKILLLVEAQHVSTNRDAQAQGASPASVDHKLVDIPPVPGSPYGGIRAEFLTDKDIDALPKYAKGNGFYDFAMRHFLKMAIDKGYDGVALQSGKQVNSQVAMGGGGTRWVPGTQVTTTPISKLLQENAFVLESSGGVDWIREEGIGPQILIKGSGYVDTTAIPLTVEQFTEIDIALKGMGFGGGRRWRGDRVEGQLFHSALTPAQAAKVSKLVDGLGRVMRLDEGNTWMVEENQPEPGWVRTFFVSKSGEIDNIAVTLQHEGLKLSPEEINKVYAGEKLELTDAHIKAEGGQAEKVYDNQLPNILKDYVKKFKGKISNINIVTEKGKDFSGRQPYRISDAELRERVTITTSQKGIMFNETVKEMLGYGGTAKARNPLLVQLTTTPGMTKDEYLAKRFPNQTFPEKITTKVFDYAAYEGFRKMVNTEDPIPVRTPTPSEEGAMSGGTARTNKAEGGILYNPTKILAKYEQYRNGNLVLNKEVIPIPKGLSRTEFAKFVLEHERAHMFTGLDGSKMDENIISMLALERIGRDDIAKIMEDQIPADLKKGTSEPGSFTAKQIKGSGKATRWVDDWMKRKEKGEYKPVEKVAIESTPVKPPPPSTPENQAKILRQTTVDYLRDLGVTDTETLSDDHLNTAVYAMTSKEKMDLAKRLKNNGYLGEIKIVPAEDLNAPARPDTTRLEYQALKSGIFQKGAPKEGGPDKQDIMANFVAEGDSADKLGKIVSRESLNESEIVRDWSDTMYSISDLERQVERQEKIVKQTDSYTSIYKTREAKLTELKESLKWLKDQAKQLKQQHEAVSNQPLEKHPPDFEDFGFPDTVKAEETPAVGKDGKALQAELTGFKLLLNRSKTYGWKTALLWHKKGPYEKSLAAEEVQAKQFIKPNETARQLVGDIFQAANMRDRFKTVYAGVKHQLIEGLWESTIRHHVYKHLSVKEQQKIVMDKERIAVRALEEIIVNRDAKLEEHSITENGAGGVYLDKAEAIAVADDAMVFKQYHNHKYEDLLKERPEKLFFNMLDRPEQHIVEAVQRDIMAPLRDHMVQAGLMGDHQTIANVMRGFSHRVTREPKWQKEGAIKGVEWGEMGSGKIWGQKYRTYSQYHKESLLSGLIPIDRLGDTVSHYGVDYATRLFNAEKLKEFAQADHPEIRQNEDGTETINDPNVKSGMKVVAYESQFDVGQLTAAGYRQLHKAPGLVRWWKGSFEKPWVHASVYDMLRYIYEPSDAGQILRGWNQLNGAIKRMVMWTPGLFFPQVTSSGALWSTKTAKVALGEYFKLLPGMADSMNKARKGETAPFEAMKDIDPRLQELFQKHGLNIWDYGDMMHSFWNTAKSEYAEHPRLQSEWQQGKDFVQNRFGMDAYIFQKAIPKVIYTYTKALYERFKSQGLDDNTAAKQAVIFANDTSGLAKTNLMGKDYPLIRGLFFAPAFTGTFVRQVTGALSGVPGVGKVFHQPFRTTKPGSLFNFFFHAEKTPAELKALQPYYTKQLLKVTAAKIMMMYFIQLGLSYMNPDVNEHGKSIFHNDKGKRLQVKTPWKTEQGDPIYLDFLMFREASQLIDLIGNVPPFYGRGAGKLFQSKLVSGVSQFLEQMNNQDYMGNEIYAADAKFPERMASRGKHFVKSALPQPFRTDTKQIPFAAPAQMLGASPRAGSQIPEEFREAKGKYTAFRKRATKGLQEISIEELALRYRQGKIDMKTLLTEIKRRGNQALAYFKRNKKAILWGSKLK